MTENIKRRKWLTGPNQILNDLLNAFGLKRYSYKAAQLSENKAIEIPRFDNSSSPASPYK